MSCKPKCPHCTKRIANWETTGWTDNDQLCTCDKCGASSSYAELKWKQECGFGRCGFYVTHIYPHEAVPTEQLLQLLKENTGIDWDYCYANNEQ